MNNKEAPQAPYGALLCIFSYLSRQDISRTAQVCKLWHQVSSEECFGWIEAHIYNLTTYGASATWISDRVEGKPVAFSHWFKVTELDSNGSNSFLFGCKLGPIYVLEITVKGKTFNLGKLMNGHLKVTFHNVVQASASHPRLWRCKIVETPLNYYVFVAELNKQVVAKMMAAHEEIPLYPFFDSWTSKPFTKYLNSIKEHN